MFNKKIVLCFYIVLLVLTLNCTKLLDSRVANYTTNYYTESGHSGTINYYYYSTPNSMLIDSITVYNFSQSNTTYSHTKRFTHEVQMIGSDKITTYRYYLNGVYKNKYIFTENQFGRITRYALYNHMDTAYPDSNAYYIHYNSALKPDSLYQISFPVNATYQYSYTVYSYDNNGLLTNSNSYILSSGTWIPDVRTTLYYSASSYHYSNPLQLDKTSAKTLRYSTIDFYSLSDTGVMPDSLRREIWFNNNWQQFTQYIIYHSPDLVFFEYGSLMHSFNNLGLYRGYTQMGQDIYGEGITWETITSVEDNVLPNPSRFFTAYPNPFKNNLNIKIDGKTPVNSDISIYNIKGQLIRNWKGIKSNELTWDSKDKDNKPVKSGVYLIKARQGLHSSTIKIVKY